MQDVGLDGETLEWMRAVFARDPRIEEVLLYGSRAKGTFREGSDIDLAIFGIEDFSSEAAIAGRLDDLPLLYKFDVHAYNRIAHQPLRDHIDRVGISIYRRAPQP